VILSFLFFREPITRGKALGNVLIFAGIVIFYLNWAEISPSLEFLVTDFGTLFSSLG
jgi:drug/metabolite transporter (DMT)-like permease